MKPKKTKTSAQISVDLNPSRNPKILYKFRKMVKAERSVAGFLVHTWP